MNTGKKTPLGMGRATANAVNSSCKIKIHPVTCMYKESEAVGALKLI